jgi:hypothetical protein
MRRVIAVLCVGLGLAMVGVALGLLYIDYRRERTLSIALMAGVAEAAQDSATPSRQPPISGTEDAKKIQAIQQWSDPTPIWIALIAGSLGAGLFGSGVLIALLEAPMFRTRT